MNVDRLIHHQATFGEAEHRPTPIIIPFLDAETELLIELDAFGHASHWQHRYEAVHLDWAPSG
jgi:hypothetical protein